MENAKERFVEKMGIVTSQDTAIVRTERRAKWVRRRIESTPREIKADLARNHLPKKLLPVDGIVSFQNFPIRLTLRSLNFGHEQNERFAKFLKTLAISSPLAPVRIRP